MHRRVCMLGIMDGLVEAKDFEDVSRKLFVFWKISNFTKCNSCGSVEGLGKSSMQYSGVLFTSDFVIIMIFCDIILNNG